MIARPFLSYNRDICEQISSCNMRRGEGSWPSRAPGPQEGHSSAYCDDHDGIKTCAFEGTSWVRTGASSDPSASIHASVVRLAASTRTRKELRTAEVDPRSG